MVQSVIEVARATRLLASPLLFLTTFVIVLGPTISMWWLFHLSTTGTNSDEFSGYSCGSAGGVSMAAAVACCTTVRNAHYALGLIPSMCFDGASATTPAEVTGSTMTSESTTSQNNTLIALIPWFISLVLGIVGPVLFLLAQYQIWRGDLRLEDDFLSDFPWTWVGVGADGSVVTGSSARIEERKMQMMMKQLSNYTRMVEETDIVRESCSKAICSTSRLCPVDEPTGQTFPNNHDGNCGGSLLVPKPGQVNTDGQVLREVQNLCAICFNDYKAGEDIVWSMNCDCIHVFHRGCLQPWLRRNPWCPMCRGTFVEC